MKKNILKTKMSLVLVFALVFLCVSHFVFAAELNLKFDKKITDINEEVSLDIILTSDDLVNVVSGIINFPDELLSVSKVNDSGSIVNMWIEGPSVDTEGEIKFSGIIPGGFWGSDGKVATIIFRTKNKGKAAIYLSEVKMFLNDGKGTEIKAEVGEDFLQIRNMLSQSGNKIDFDYDKERPEPFVLQIEKEQDMFGGKWFVSFVAHDKGSGVKEYQIMEHRLLSLLAGKWENAESPYVLKDQSLRSTIFVKAIDNAGNERVSKLLPQNQIAAQNSLWLIGGILIILYWLWKKTKK